MIATIDDYLAGVAPPGSALWCPFHDDHRRPSAMVMRDTGRFWCFVCRWGGGPVDVARRLWFPDLPVAIGTAMASAYLARAPGYASTAPLPPPPSPDSEPDRDPLIVQVMTVWTRLCQEALRAHPQLCARIGEERGLRDPVALGVGVASFGTARRLDQELAGIVPDWIQTRRTALARAGIWYDDGRYRLGARLILPSCDAGQTLSYQARHQQRDHPVRYLNPPSWPKAVAGLPSLEAPGPVWIVEGWFDAAPLWEAGASALAVGGLGARGLPALIDRIGRRPVGIVFDRDARPATRATVEQAASTLLDRLRAAGIDAVQLTPPPPYKDVGEWATAVGGRRVCEELAAQRWVAHLAPQ